MKINNISSHNNININNQNNRKENNMEIKIVDIPLREGNHKMKTFMCEAHDVNSERVYFSDFKDFHKKFEEFTNNMEGGITHSLNNYWLKDKEKELEKVSGYFVFCKYKDRNNELVYIAFKDQKMYVTNAGFTVGIIE